ncbi:MAG TPA: winged helix-turn-helix domain-containing protein [candidate division Zixibacteria bacterium]|nr:winged helix-turn-helix domain-containing protein [candidate division Zixibacteria bacterium]
MDEAKYRESRVCRLLGNPVVYQLVLFLDNGGPLTPSQLAKHAGRSVQTVSGHLAKLRAADLVRYNTDGKQVRYWLKHKRETGRLLRALEAVVRSASKLPPVGFGRTPQAAAATERRLSSPHRLDSF